MDGYANHGGAQHAVVEFVAGSELGEDGAVGMVVRLDALDGLVLVRVERFAFGFDACEAELGERRPEAAVDEIEALAEFFVAGVAMGFQRALEIIEHGQDGLDSGADGTVMFRGAVALDAFTVVFEIGLEADEGIQQVVALGAERIEFRARDGGRRRGGSGLPGRRFDSRSGGSRSFAFGVRVMARLFRKIAHEDRLPER